MPLTKSKMPAMTTTSQRFTPRPGNAHRKNGAKPLNHRTESRASSEQVHVAVFVEMIVQTPGNIDGAVPSAGAADADGRLATCLRPGKRGHEKIHHLVHLV